MVDAELLTDTRGDLLELLELTLDAVNALNVFLREPPVDPVGMRRYVFPCDRES